MMLTVLALSALTSTLASTKVVTRSMWTQCSGATQFGSSTVMTSVKNGCSAMGYADCANSVFYNNQTDGALSCATKTGDRYNITDTCQSGNVTLKCADIDGTQAADIVLYAGNACNGSSLGLGVVQKDTCAYISENKYVKMWMNATGSFVGVYSAAGCVASSQIYISSFTVSGLTGCAAGVLASGYQTVKWTILEAATSAPTVAGNGTNTTAPGSSGSIMVASLASVVVAAASLML
jgi:hypothetical protein